MVTKNAFLYNDYWYAILNLPITLLQFSRLFKFTLFSVQMQQSNGSLELVSHVVKKECHAEDQEMQLDKTNNSLRKRWTFSDATGTTGFPTKWRRMMHHYPALGSAFDWSRRVGNLPQPIRSTTQIWAVTRHQYGISVLVSQTSFRGETTSWRRKMLAVFLR